tara:strand:+ start:123 stop:356 length:234 start_codon:yes stop_codon:yes gene_type:complete
LDLHRKIRGFYATHNGAKNDFCLKNNAKICLMGQISLFNWYERYKSLSFLDYPLRRIAGYFPDIENVDQKCSIVRHS